MEHAEADLRLLDAADELFYARGIHAVGMDDVRAASGVSLKRLYQRFGSKDELVAAYLRRRDKRWRGRLADSVLRHKPGRARVLAVFDWLYAWFSEPGFRGCAFINSVGELGGTSPEVVRIAKHHKDELKRFLLDLLRESDVDNPKAAAEQLLLLIDGAIVAAAVNGQPAAAKQARRAAESLIRP